MMDQSERDRVDKITEAVHYLLNGVQVSRIVCSDDPDDEIRQLAGKVNELNRQCHQAAGSWQIGPGLKIQDRISQSI